MFGLFSDHVFKMKFDPLLNCRTMNFDPFLIFEAKFYFSNILKVDQTSFEHVVRKLPEHMLCLASGSKFI